MKMKKINNTTLQKAGVIWLSNTFTKQKSITIKL